MRPEAISDVLICDVLSDAETYKKRKFEDHQDHAAVLSLLLV